MLVESLGYNLLSVSRLADFGFNVLFTKVDCQVFRQDNHNMVFTGFHRGDLLSISLRDPNLVVILLQNLLKVGFGIED